MSEFTEKFTDAEIRDILDENENLRDQLNSQKDKAEKLHRKIDSLEMDLRVRTTALCALLNLGGAQHAEDSLKQKNSDLETKLLQVLYEIEKLKIVDSSDGKMALRKAVRAAEDL